MIPKDTPQSETTHKTPEPVEASEHKWVNTFDITKHEWISESNMGDADISVEVCDDNSLDIELAIPFENESLRSTIYKNDAIAIAKHFGLVGEGL